MSAAPFTVTPSSLSGLAGNLSGVAGEVGGIAARVRSGDAGAAGDPGLEAAISSYLNCWSSGLSRLEESLTQLQQALSSAAGGYSGTDGAVSAGLSS
jgi:hypothetical protein